MNNPLDSAKNDAYAEGRKKGREEGIRENALATVVKLWQINFPVEQIAAVTGLTMKS